MSLAIRSWERVSREEWDRTWSACRDATWFQSRAWSEVWREVTDGAMAPDGFVAEFSDGARAVLPLTRRRLWFGLDHGHEFAPAGTYGGWLSIDELTAEHAVLLTDRLLALPNLTWRVSPFLSHLPISDAMESDETHVIDLTMDSADLEARWRRSGHARKVRKAEREGVAVDVAAGVDDWRAYVSVYQESLARWGDRASSRYDWSMFEALRRQPSDQVRLWLARHDGRVVAGAVCCYAPRHVSYWHGASSESAQVHRPVNLLMARAIEHARDAGLAWFDLNPSGGHHGVLRFKESLGATPRPSPVYRSERPLRRRVRRLVGKGVPA